MRTVRDAFILGIENAIFCFPLMVIFNAAGLYVFGIIICLSLVFWTGDELIPYKFFRLMGW